MKKTLLYKLFLHQTATYTYYLIEFQRDKIQKTMIETK